MQNVGLIAERYAHALSQSVKTVEELSQVHTELSAVATLVSESDALQHVLKSPTIQSAEKLAVMHELVTRLGGSQLVKRFLTVVADHGRLAILPAIATRLSDINDERSGIRRVEIRSATSLDEDVRTRIKAALQKVAGGKVRIEEKVDPSLIGGLVAKIGTEVFDGSLRSRLQQMRARLKGQASSLAG